MIPYKKQNGGDFLRFATILVQFKIFRARHHVIKINYAKTISQSEYRNFQLLIMREFFWIPGKIFVHCLKYAEYSLVHLQQRPNNQ